MLEEECKRPESNLFDVLKGLGARVEIQCWDGARREGELVTLLLLYHHYGRLRLPLSGGELLFLPDVSVKELDIMITTITSELVDALFNEDLNFDNINESVRNSDISSASNSSSHQPQEENNENLQPRIVDTEGNVVFPGTRYSCKVCSRTYSNRRNLTKHMHLHTSPQKRFQCNQCPKNFSAKGTLKYHIETEHEGFRPAECDKCEHKFKSTYRFKMHKCDVSLEPLECSNCDFMTFRKGSYNSHIRICTLKYSCYKCNYTTQMESKFIKHCEKEH